MDCIRIPVYQDVRISGQHRIWIPSYQRVPNCSRVFFKLSKFFSAIASHSSRTANPSDNSVMTSLDILENKKSRSVFHMFF